MALYILTSRKGSRCLVGYPSYFCMLFRIEIGISSWRCKYLNDFMYPL